MGRWRCRRLVSAPKAVAAAGIGTAVLVVGMAAAAAQEEPDPPPAGSVSECGFGVVLSGGATPDLTGFPTGKPIGLGLHYVSDVPVLPFFVLEATEGGEDVRLTDGDTSTLSWTPEAAGTYTIYGEFEDAATRELVEVTDPASCRVTLGVEDAPVVDPPDGYDPPVTISGSCAGKGSGDLTLVPVGDGFFAAYDDEGNICVLIGGETVTRPVGSVRAELPATGSRATPLAATGITLIGMGWWMRRSARSRASARP